MDSLFSQFDVNANDVIHADDTLALVFSDKIEITLNLKHVNTEDLFGVYVNDFHPLWRQWEEIYLERYPEPHEFVEFMAANAEQCILRIDKRHRHEFKNEIEQAKAANMRVVFEPELSVNEVFEKIKSLKVA